MIKNSIGISKHWILFILFIWENIVTINDLRIEFIWIPLALSSSVAKHVIFLSVFEYISYIKIVPMLVNDINLCKLIYNYFIT